ncbi:MAG: hypothetical protein JWQ87_2254 [Candidatus Sulfotelmatobacter sp.]|nr:hypothetical protein [Candidatus Sulfotelmatobacter sp.]
MPMFNFGGMNLNSLQGRQGMLGEGYMGQGGQMPTQIPGQGNPMPHPPMFGHPAGGPPMAGPFPVTPGQSPFGQPYSGPPMSGPMQVPSQPTPPAYGAPPTGINLNALGGSPQNFMQLMQMRQMMQPRY